MTSRSALSRWVWLLALLVPAVRAQDAVDHSGHDHGPDGHVEHEVPYRAGPWAAELVELAEQLPIQDGGRIKPLHTYAGFTLLRFTGRRKLESAAGETLTPVEWLLDTLFFPETAAHEPLFLVQNVEVLEAIGVDIEGRERRDRYSLDELRVDREGNGLRRLFELSQQYAHIDSAERTPVQEQIVFLAGNVNHAMSLLGNVLNLPLLPPDGPVVEDEAWWTGNELHGLARQTGRLTERQQTLVDHVGGLNAARMEPERFEQHLAGLLETTVAMARERGEHDTVGLELSYYKAGWITRSLGAYLLGFVVVAALWLRPRSRVAYGLAWIAVSAGTLALTTAIVYRCLIRERPPISTLYETVLFVTAFGALLGLVMEALDRRRIALSAAAVLGVIGVFIANGYEVLDKQDTMPSLVAVLDTNFWLATHVTAITIGYSAGLFAALLANIYIVTRAFGFKRDDPSFGKALTRMTYGALCFSAIFSIVGTILGGIWANESWGRFWGWDPKENGALLIVIAQVAILHGRMGGFLRQDGICIATAFSGTVIAFSWWGVNLLGVGLHSYGFTSGIARGLWTYYGLQWTLCAVGCVVATRAAAGARSSRSTEAIRGGGPSLAAGGTTARQAPGDDS